ncbi:DNA mismatch repair protein MSH6 [Acorus calamus]|uniref:DNA mismatch repair protein MSH6 n=1 Tax=Acorus calamus TaxID=4465 RepID=A0AAV9CYG5_ACOCL|nr:DNA mismatch repair protein MSH6 [Acorus calamus]
MAYAEKSPEEQTLEEQLLEVGGRLASPPSTTEEILALLDHTEGILSKVQQSPSESTTKALDPALKALVAKELLRHSNTDVKVSVASCISEITRITAPDAPYEDDLMKEIFQMIVEAFENLSDTSGRSYAKRVSILETVAKVRSCVVMLDLECDGLILDMFHHFFNTIRDNHPDSVLSSMETIMSLVLEESEEISPELLSSLLNSVKKENKDVLPIACKLGEKVIISCSAKLKPLLIEAIRSAGASFNDYSKIIATVCDEACSPVPNNMNSSGENLADESKLSDRTVSDELPQGAAKPESGSLEEVGVTDKSPKSVMSNGTAQVDEGSSKYQNSPNDSDHSRTESERESVENLDKKGDDGNAEGGSASDGPVKESIERLDNVNKAELQQSSELHGDNDRDALQSPQEPDVVHLRRSKPQSKGSAKKGREKPTEQKEKSLKIASEDEVVPSSIKKEIRGTSKSSVKSSKLSAKKGRNDLDAGIGETTPSTNIIAKKDNDGTSESEGKMLKRSGKNVHSSTESQEESAVKDKSKSHKRKSLSQDDEAEHVSLKKMVSSRKSATKASSEEQSHLDGSKSKKKRVKGTEKTSEASGKDKGLGKDIVGSQIKVWWPDDAMFYNGVIESFDPITKKHKVHYDDGDEEILLLKNERWEFIDGDTATDVVQSADPQTPDVPPEMMKKRKASTESGSVSKKGKTSAPRSETTLGGKVEEDALDNESNRKDGSGSKPRGRPKGTVSKVSASSPKSVSKSVEGSSEPENKSKEIQSSGKMKDKSLKIETKSNDDTLKGVGKSKEETPKTGKSKDGTRKSGSKMKYDSDSKSKEDPPKPSSKMQEDTSKSGRKSKDISSSVTPVSKASSNGASGKGTPAPSKGKDDGDSAKAGSSKAMVRESEEKSGKKRRRKS